ncbi:MAG: VWA domain-containing protein [Phycisphaerales bacterium]|nr:VWA domain-containing protein [Phycisphaerales bacterium]
MKRALIMTVLFCTVTGAGPAVEFALDLTYDNPVASMFPEYAVAYSSGDPFLPPSIRIQPLKATKDAAAKAVDIIRSSGYDDLVCAVAYAEHVDWVEPLTFNYERVRLKIRGANRSRNPSTSLHLGIEAGKNELVSVRGRNNAEKVLVLMTDGNSDSSDALAEAQLAADAGIKIHTVGLGSDVDQGLLNQIASMGGGQSLHIANNTDPSVYGPQLEAVFKNLAEEVGFMLIQ